jgi:hypothetical protein
MHKNRESQKQGRKKKKNPDPKDYVAEAGVSDAFSSFGFISGNCDGGGEDVVG